MLSCCEGKAELNSRKCLSAVYRRLPFACTANFNTPHGKICFSFHIFTQQMKPAMKRSVKILWRCFWGGLSFVVLLFVCAAAGLFGRIPTIEELENPEADVASEIYSADGVLMGRLYVENRSEVRYSQISPYVIKALIATEDVRFREHAGIDGKSVARAVIKLGSDGGGSTITQQLAKMILKQGGGNPFIRIRDKIKEWIVAVKLERNLTKDEIITLYLNRAPWGQVYGIRNAALTYFQKEPGNLTLGESAVLVGM